MSGIDRFMAEYEKQLALAVAEHPEEYSWASISTVIHGNTGRVVCPVKTVAEVAQKMRTAIMAKTYSHDGRAFQRTCKALGINRTYTAINAFVATK
jgi:hypothetical protein